VSDVLDGTNLSSCQDTLRDSIAAGEAWKAVYESTKSAVDRKAGDDASRRWDFREASLFAQIDAFVQRCKDLMEVCEAQEQFAGKSGVPPPVFAGTKGPEIAQTMSEIENDFVELVDSLRGLDYHLMDIKATSWHDDYNQFKEGVKDLDQRTITMYTSALAAASGLEGKTETLEALNQMARRVGREATRREANRGALFRVYERAGFRPETVRFATYGPAGTREHAEARGRRDVGQAAARQAVQAVVQVGGGV
jgi:dynein heavy chain